MTSIPSLAAPSNSQPNFLAPIQGLSRALDVLYNLQMFLPQQRVIATQGLGQFSRDHFGEEAPETQDMMKFAQSLLTQEGVLSDPSALKELFFQWRGHEGPPSDVRCIPHLSSPLFEAGPVRFFQSRQVPTPIQPDQIPQESSDGGIHLISNEPLFGNYYPIVSDSPGGVVLGVGAFQTLNLAAASEASGILFVDISSSITRTLALLLPIMARQPTAAAFVNDVRNFLNGTTDPTPYMEPVPHAFRPTFRAHVEDLRRFQKGTRLLKFLDRSLHDPSHVLGNAPSYEFVSNLIGHGGAAIIHGNLFGEDMPDLVTSAIDVYQEQLRTVYVSNAPEQATLRKKGHSMEAFLKILEDPRTDPDGHFLITTEFPHNQAVKAQKRRTGDTFTYHAMRMGAAAALLRSYGLLPPFVRRFKSYLGLEAAPQIG